jgi:hypothetical protein
LNRGPLVPQTGSTVGRQDPNAEALEELEQAQRTWAFAFREFEKMREEMRQAIEEMKTSAPSAEGPWRYASARARAPIC